MESITIKLGTSTQQLADIEQIRSAAHSMAGAALDVVKNGSQGYDQFLASKDQFDNTIDNYFKNYKYCEIIK